MSEIFTPKPTERDWFEDENEHGENMYLCLCSSCDKTFNGYKRRIICKACHIQPQAEQIKQLEAKKVRLEEECLDIHLGHGDKIVSDIYNIDEGWAGICVSHGECPVGENYKTDAKTDKELGAFMRIITSNPKSLDVVIDKLTKAKGWLNNQ